MTILRKGHARYTPRLNPRLGLAAMALAAGLIAAPSIGIGAQSRTGSGQLEFSRFEVRPVIELTVREGPGTRFPAIGVIAPRASADVLGCLEDTTWCEVVFGDKTGWVNAEYLLPDLRGRRFS